MCIHFQEFSSPESKRKDQGDKFSFLFYAFVFRKEKKKRQNASHIIRKERL
jgi:hypothetical protein